MGQTISARVAERSVTQMSYETMLLLRLGFLLWSLLGFSLPCFAVDSELAALEQQVHDLVNAHRQGIGLNPLAYSKEIARIARQHSQDMATGRAGVGHQGVDERRDGLFRVISFKEFAENVGGNSYASSRTAHETVEGWLKSPGHRQNIEGDFNLTGVGIAQSATGLYFFTQIFLTTSATRSNSDESNRSISRLNLSWLVMHPLRKRSRAGSLSLPCVILIVVSPETFELRSVRDEYYRHGHTVTQAVHNRCVPSLHCPQAGLLAQQHGLVESHETEQTDDTD